MKKALLYLLPLLTVPLVSTAQMEPRLADDGRTFTATTAADFKAFVYGDPATKYPAVTTLALAGDITLEAADVTANTTIGYTLDGRGHTITLEATNLCETLGAKGVIKNTRFDITGKKAPNITDGLLVATNKGTITSCAILGYANNIAPKLEAGQVTALGGVCGINEGSITECLVGTKAALVIYGKVIPKAVYIGNIVGINKGAIKSCFIPSQVIEANGKYSPKGEPMNQVISMSTGLDKASTDKGAAPEALVQGLTAAKNEGTIEQINGWKDVTKLIDASRFQYAENGVAEPNVKFTVSESDKGVKEFDPTNDAEMEAVILRFANPLLWTFDKVSINGSNDSKDFLRYPYPTMRSNAASIEVKDDYSVVLAAKDATGLVDLFGTLADPTLNELYRKNDKISIDLAGEIKFAEAPADLGNLNNETDATMKEKLPTLPVVSEFNGTLNGGVISNLAVCSQGLFAKLGDKAKVTGLVLDNATLYVDPSTCGADEENVYVPVFAQKIEGPGTLQVGFSGDVVVDAAKLPQNKELALCLVDEFDAPDNDPDNSATINGFLYINRVATEGSNKICITIKQNLGTGRNKPNGGYNPPKQKVATNGKPAVATKGLSVDDNTTAADVNELTRTFPDEAFRDGSVAYWLNFDGKGYSGTYVNRWSQGDTKPVPALLSIGDNGANNAIAKVEYKVEGDKGASDSELQTLTGNITSAPVYCNNGGNLTIQYRVKPTSISNGSALVRMGETQATLAYDASKPVTISYATSALEPVADRKPMLRDGIYSLRGEPLNAMQRGVCIVVVNGKAHLVRGK